MRFRMTVVCTLLLMTCASAFAAQEIGKLSYVEGRVDRAGGTDTQYLPVVKEETVSVGDIVRTKSYSRAEIIFADRSVLRLADNTQVQVQDYVLNADGSRKTASLLLDRGKIRTTVAKTKEQSPFIIQTPNASGVIKGSDMFVSFQKSATSVLALEGNMALRNLAFPDKVVELQPRSTALVGPETPPSEPRPFAPIEQKRLDEETAPLTTIKDGGKQLDSSKALVTKITGEVLSRVGGNAPGHRVEAKEAITSGSDIETGPHGQVEIVLESGRVIQLQPNTRLSIKKLSRDPKTGAREDLFESTLGKIRVSVEKLKANSKFEIKTPTAIAGVRGTVMYLNIVPEGTTVFFEGGTGYIGNMGLGGQVIVKDVGDGKNASVDDKGHVSDPAPTQPTQRQSMEGGWDPQAEKFGYSNPDSQGANETREAFSSLNERGEDRREARFDRDNTSSNPLFDREPPISPPNDRPTSGLAAPRAISLSLHGNGFFGADGTFAENPSQTWNATLSSDTNVQFWNGTRSAQATLLGTYNNGNPPAVWWKNMSGSSNDGGRFFGRLGGSFHSWEGTFAAISIDPSRRAGVAFGLLSGGSSETPSGVFFGSGLITNIPVKDLAIEPADIVSYAQEGIVDDGHVDGHFGASQIAGNFIGGRLVAGATLFLNGNPTAGASEPFGIFDLKFGGNNTFGNPSILNTWSGALAGSGAFGHFASQQEDKGFWFLKVSDGVWSNGVLNGGLDGSYLTLTRSGKMQGNLHGVYNGNSAGTWAAVGLGGFSGQALDFAGKASGLQFGRFETTTAQVPFFGGGEGILGGLGNLYRDSKTSSISLMGKYSGITQTEPLVWGWDLNSYDVYHNTKTTFDGGAFLGSLGGSWMDKRFFGAAKMLYISPLVREDGKYDAGVLSGEVMGEYGQNSFPGTDGLWALTGDVTTTRKGITAIAPANLLVVDSQTQQFINLDDTKLLGKGLGKFITGGALELKNFDGEALRIHPQNWGLWRAKMGGVFAQPNSTFSFAGGILENPTPVNPTVSSVWLTATSGHWNDTPGSASGDLTGSTKGVWVSVSELDQTKLEARLIAGTVVGNHNAQSATWQAVGLGEWMNIATLDQQAVGYTMNTLTNFVSIPITEKYSALLATAGSFNGGAGAIAATMDTSFYSSNLPTQGIWTGILNGGFTGMPQSVSTWTATVNGVSNAGQISAALSGLQWQNGKWLANVASNPGSAINFTGQAGGTYTPATENTSTGTMQGAGTGTWDKPQ